MVIVFYVGFLPLTSYHNFFQIFKGMLEMVEMMTSFFCLLDWYVYTFDIEKVLD
jgi:hypothetical protein